MLARPRGHRLLQTSNRRRDYFRISDLHLCRATHHDFVFSVADFRHQLEATCTLVFPDNRRRSLHVFADAHWFAERQVLPEIQCMLAWQVHSHKLREQRGKQHTVNNARPKLRRSSILRIYVQWTEISADRREPLNVFLFEASLD